MTTADRTTAVTDPGTPARRAGHRRRAGLTGRMARLRLAALGVAGAALLSGCGLGTAGGFIPTGDLAGEVAGVDLSGSEVAVGSKNFNESVLLGKMTVLLAQAAGADVQDLTNMPGSASARQAQVEGLVDVEWEYTGTAWLTYLGHEDPIPDPQAQWEAVRDEDAQIGLTWLPPAELDNTYAFTVRQDTAERLGVRSLADIKDLPEQEQTFCVDAEFASRNDGFRPLLAAYGLGDLPDSRVRIMDIGAVYQAVANGECTFGEAYATDGRIAALDLAVLEDPLPFFPSYNVAPVVREEALAEDPELAVLLEAMRVRLDNETAAELNARIDVYGEEPVDVAWDWLVAEGLLTERQD